MLDAGCGTGNYAVYLLKHVFGKLNLLFSSTGASYPSWWV